MSGQEDVKACNNCKYFYQMAEHDMDGDCKIEIMKSKVRGGFVRPLFKLRKDESNCGPNLKWWEPRT